MAEQLTSRKKWQLAIRLFLLYTPLLLYVNLPESTRNGDSLLHILPFLLGFSAPSLLLYFAWINATDWCQRQLFRRFGDDFLLEFSWFSFLLTIVITLVLAVVYIFAFRQIIGGLFYVIFHIWPSAHPTTNEPQWPAEVFSFFQRANNGFSIVIMISAFDLTFNARAYQQLKDVQFRAERLEKQAVLSQFEALKNQLSPHFLFNSLSILTSLIHEDVQLSEQFIKQLSKAYRYILEQRDQDLVALKTELEFIQAYTFLLQIRFETKFDVNINVPEATQNKYRIAPLSLQMLVENAVKHNRMSAREPLKVDIYEKDGFLIVDNTLQPRDQPEYSTGVGLRNITNRYSLLTDKPVWFGEHEGYFVVKIPLLTEQTNG